jgi:hypothetical protein
MDLTSLSIAKCLEYCYITIGLRSDNKPTEDSYSVLVSFIKENYGMLSLEDVAMAFKLGSAGKEYKADMNHFQTFSPLYFAGVVNPYMEYRKRAIAIVNKERRDEEIKTLEQTPEEILEYRRRFVYKFIVPSFYNYFKTGNIDFETALVSHVYGLLEDDYSLIHESKEHKVDRCRRIYNDLPKILRKESEEPKTKLQQQFKDQVKKVLDGNDKGTRKAMVIEIARKEIIAELFEVINRSEKSIEQSLGLTEWIENKRKASKLKN